VKGGRIRIAIVYSPITSFLVCPSVPKATGGQGMMIGFIDRLAVGDLVYAQLAGFDCL